ncbi:MAG: hypothetical protein ACTMK5_07575, partial [Pseudomonas helleri]
SSLSLRQHFSSMVGVSPTANRKTYQR